MNAIINISPQTLRQAAAVQEHIQQLQAELRRILEPVVSGGDIPVKGRRKLSPEGLARIRAAQRRRWAKQGKSRTAVPRKSKRKLSAEARAKIAAVARARWAAAKKAGRSTL